MRWGRIILALGLVAIASAPLDAWARGPKKAAARAGKVRLAIFAMNGTDVRLPTIPYKLVSFTLPFNGNQSAAVAGSYVVASDVKGFSVELEAQGVQHFGNEKSFELTGAVILRSPQFGITKGTSANVAVGNGISYALTAPTAEMGRGGIVGVDTVKFQYHLSVEAELTGSKNSRVHYVARLHHRSGIYGLISPSKTGSNYIGLGLRFDLGR